MNKPLLISYYTGDGYYKKCSDDLKDMCDSLSIDIEIEKVKDLGNYWKNTLYKPVYILEKIKEKKRDIIWIDVDTRIKKYPDCFKKWNSDLLFSSHTGDLQGIKASPIGFKYNERCLEFLKNWGNKCKEKIDVLEIDMDHDVLKYETIPFFTKRISIEIMKDNYNFKDFSDGEVIDNGISNSYTKHIEVKTVMDKNKKRSVIFNSLNINFFE